jgi:hypothetical protein
MAGAIASGSEVLVVAGDRPRRGEVCAFVNDDGDVVVHRFLREVNGRMWFRGDSNASPDRAVAPELLIGRVGAVRDRRGERRFGHAQRWRARAELDLLGLRRRLARIGRARDG